MPYLGDLAASYCGPKIHDRLFDLRIYTLRLGRFRTIPVREQYGLCQVRDKVTRERTSHYPAETKPAAYAKGSFQ